MATNETEIGLDKKEAAWHKGISIKKDAKKNKGGPTCEQNLSPLSNILASVALTFANSLERKVIIKMELNDPGNPISPAFCKSAVNHSLQGEILFDPIN